MRFNRRRTKKIVSLKKSHGADFANSQEQTIRTFEQRAKQLRKIAELNDLLDTTPTKQAGKKAQRAAASAFELALAA